MTAQARWAGGGVAQVAVPARLLALIGGGAFATAVGLEITDQPLAGAVVAAALGGVALLLAAAPSGDPVRRSRLLAAAAAALVLAVEGGNRLHAGPLTALLYLPALGLVALAAVGVRDAARHRQALAHARTDGIERERRRWALELHDQTLQQLGALRVLLDMAGTATDLAGARTLTEQAGRLVGSEIESLRNLIFDLHPVVLDQFGLAPAAEALCRRARVQAGPAGPEICCLIKLPGDEGRPVRFDIDAETCVYRVVQEALGNAVRHAAASRIAVAVEQGGGTVTARVTDDGRGMAGGRGGAAGRRGGAAGTGLGLPGMRERAALAGGRLVVESAAGRGVRITLTVPTGNHAAARGAPTHVATGQHARAGAA